MLSLCFGLPCVNPIPADKAPNGTHHVGLDAADGQGGLERRQEQGAVKRPMWREMPTWLLFVTTRKALVTTSVALVPSSFLFLLDDLGRPPVRVFGFSSSTGRGER